MNEDQMPARPNDPWADFVAGKLRDLTDESIEMRARIAENTALTQDTKDSIYELMAIIQMGRGFFRFCSLFGKGLNKLARWLAPIVAVSAGIYAFVQQWVHGK